VDRSSKISKGSGSPLIEAMRRTGFYPERAERIDFKQTHMSYVFLAGEYVYKVKKPVHFDFADCSTLATRYELCCEEVRLNRRLAPEIYLGVLPIYRDHNRFYLGEETRSFDPAAHEYAVRMRRLPDDRMLDRLVRAGQISLADIDTLAKRLAGFHQRAFTPGASRHGSATSIGRSVLHNLDECEQFIGETITAEQFAAIHEYLKGFVAAHHELLNNRARHGYVRDGHGDLRCEHVCMTENIQIFDCLEFSESLRCVDVASDIGFLAMDLDSLGAFHLADELVHTYARETGDDSFATLITFYQCYRACVRGKVEGLKSLEHEVPDVERDEARDRAHAFFSLAYRYASRARPALVIVCGLSGTGKSTVSRTLRNRTGFEVLDSDRIRKRLAGVPERSRSESAYAAGIYAPAFDRLTYDTLIAEAEDHLRNGRGVIVDATFKRREDRLAIVTVANRCGVPVLFIECQANQAEVLSRLSERSRKGDDPSDATQEVYLHQRAEFAPLREFPARHHLVVDTTTGIEHALTGIEYALSHLL
jgi:uncharacterized protein